MSITASLQKLTGTIEYFDLPEVKKLIRYIVVCDQQSTLLYNESIALWMANGEENAPQHIRERCSYLTQQSHEYIDAELLARKDFLNNYKKIVKQHLENLKEENKK